MDELKTITAVFCISLFVFGLFSKLYKIIDILKVLGISIIAIITTIYIIASDANVGLYEAFDMPLTFKVKDRGSIFCYLMLLLLSYTIGLLTKNLVNNLKNSRRAQ